MTKEQSLRVNNVSQAVDDLFRHFGVWATVKAMLVVAWQHQQTKSHVTHLSDHLRRDIGLPVNKSRSGPPLIPPWFPRF
ncbi:DUF1127 domain-containing protein [Agrobacterium sp. rho-13.3]|jgi:hypothetical protein|uniref:DUF1127 domain-containing protein n=1 Tax=Agrobacterium sp. rho-13.3 TaxID=3072980 RepID=UPI002A0E4985|nr:DUF1127 domain-containing protein [Agrobacterium sp. rho-13.3]MDX8311367.1 DUF1127 domain-containing protein [Agrobacterium sp. rho-13.3]